MAKEDSLLRNEERAALQQLAQQTHVEDVIDVVAVHIARRIERQLVAQLLLQPAIEIQIRGNADLVVGILADHVQLRLG